MSVITIVFPDDHIPPEEQYELQCHLMEAFRDPDYTVITNYGISIHTINTDRPFHLCLPGLGNVLLGEARKQLEISKEDPRYPAIMPGPGHVTYL